MKNQQRIKVIIPTGILIGLIWQFLQISFFTNSWAQPGTTSIPLFVAQITSVILLLLISFRIYRDQFQKGLISFGKCMLLGIGIGITSAFFGIFFFQIYTNSINTGYESWLQEMYLQSWTQRGLSESQIQEQLSTNLWLESPLGMIYSLVFATGLIAFLSIFPAIFTSRFSNNNQTPEFG